MKLPCEHAMWYTLPRIRAELAKTLVKKGVSQKEVARKLGVTPAAVSQYLHKKRGEKEHLPAQQEKLVEEAAEELKNSEGDEKIMALICRCCKG